MFIPKKIKYKKHQKGKKISKIYSLTNNNINFNSTILISKDFGFVQSKQIKAFKYSINKVLKKGGRLLIYMFAHTPVTKKPLEVRMGKGKGAVNFWVAKIKPGTSICKIESCNKNLANKALIYAKKRLSIKTKIINFYD